MAVWIVATEVVFSAGRGGFQAGRTFCSLLGALLPTAGVGKLACPQAMVFCFVFPPPTPAALRFWLPPVLLPNVQKQDFGIESWKRAHIFRSLSLSLILVFAQWLHCVFKKMGCGGLCFTRTLAGVENSLHYILLSPFRTIFIQLYYFKKTTPHT